MKCIVFVFLFSPLFILAQKKPLDHTVYDGWQSIGERAISNDGNWVVYSVTPQEGDAMLYIRSTRDNFTRPIPRGYNAQITEDSRFVIFRIRPLFSQTRDARIKKKKPEDFPKDSLGIVELGKDTVIKYARLKSFKTPAKAAGWLALQKEKDPVVQGKTASPTQKTVDSLKKTIDSLVMLVTQVKNMKAGNRDLTDAADDPVTLPAAAEGSDLVIRDLSRGKDAIFRNVVDYVFNDQGQMLVMRVSKSPADSFSANAVVVYDLVKSKRDTILKGGNDFRNFSWNEKGNRLAFLAERDTSATARQRYYGLYYYQPGDDSALLLTDKNSVGMKVGTTISENGQPAFSKSGNRLFFGTAPIPSLRDTSLVEIDLVKLDIWHYKDDYLQTQQLFQLNNELKRNYTALFDFSTNRTVQLADRNLPTLVQTKEGDGDWFIGITDTGRRVEAQWSGTTKKDIYAVKVGSGEKILVRKNHSGQVYPSSTGKYILLYDNRDRHYYAWDGRSLKNITAKIKTPLYNEEHDVPGDPSPYGLMGWHEGDSAVYIYDRYDVWKVDPAQLLPPKNITRVGRIKNESFRYVRLDPEEKFLKSGQPLFFQTQNSVTKQNGFTTAYFGADLTLTPFTYDGKYTYGLPAKAKSAPVFIYTRENYSNSPDLYLHNGISKTGGHSNTVSRLNEERITALNPQQKDYNWGTAELYKWKALNGKAATGILYKPEDFDSTRKYPMIIYFYEKLSSGLYNYIAPAPTPSRLNIPFFVSRGYLVFAPDICYTKGHPGKDAYNYIVSGAQSLGKKKWVDSKNIGIQGQSWGGYQVAYLITVTNLFKAAWAGAPVVNMFSAYGGIRWESGNNRQFQYEKGQSRIGATPWEKPQLYIENSPFFHLNKVNTPLVIMANDADGAVPWYQGIEFFTAMRRLGKKVWLLNYNGEAHNLVERKNRKDIQIREQQYFDWLLKGEKPAKWIVEGVPAVKKGKDWGLETSEYF